MDYYIYVYLDPRKPGNFIYDDLKFDFEPIYIGKGRNNRINSHLNLRGKNKYFVNKLKNILEQNLTPIQFKLYENLKEETSYKLEEEAINKIGRLLVNVI